jgi:hypothetical protein
VCQPGLITLEVAAQQDAHPADGRVPAVLVEQLSGEGAQLAAIAQEGLERARQATIDVGEILSQHLVHLSRDTLVERLGLADHGLEFTAHHVHVERGARVLQGQQADAQGARHECRSIVGGALSHEGGEARIDESKVVDEDALSRDIDAGGPVGRWC